MLKCWLAHSHPQKSNRKRALFFHTKDIIEHSWLIHLSHKISNQSKGNDENLWWSTDILHTRHRSDDLIHALLHLYFFTFSLSLNILFNAASSAEPNLVFYIAQDWFASFDQTKLSPYYTITQPCSRRPSSSFLLCQLLSFKLSCVKMIGIGTS